MSVALKERLRLESSTESYPGEGEDIEDLISDISKRPEEDQKLVLGALERYTEEGENDAYTSDTSGLRKFIAEKGLLANSESVTDLGGGSGDLIADLSIDYPEKKFLGIDLSPSFVRKFNKKKEEKESKNSAMRIGLIDSPGILDRNKKMTEGSVISVLTLDRVADPRQLIQNMAKFAGAKILSALLPMNPIDDNPSIPEEKRRVYTRPEKRIVPGVDAAQDREKILVLAKELWGTDVQVEEIDYTVNSSGDEQVYKLVTFYSK